MLETVREYALERLDAGGELEAVRRRHAQASPTLAGEAERGHGEPDSARGSTASTPSARTSAPRSPSPSPRAMPTTALRAVRRLLALLGLARQPHRGPRARSPRRSRSTAATPERGSGRSTARACWPASRATSPPRKALFEESLALAREAGDGNRAARVSGNLGNLALYEDDYDEAIERYEEATAFCARVDDERGLSLMLQNLGIAHARPGTTSARSSC